MGPRAAWRLESLGFRDVYWYDGGKMDWLAFNLPSEGSQREKPMAGDIIRSDAPTCRLGETIGDVRGRMGDGWSQCLVLNEHRVILGRVWRRHLENPDGRRVEDVMDEGPSTYRPSIPVEELVATMQKAGFETAVISDSTGVLLGLMRREDAEAALRGLPVGAAAR